MRSHVVSFILAALGFFSTVGSAVQIEAKVRDPEPWMFRWADHTYVCAKPGQCYATNGGTSGGNTLQGTQGNGEETPVRCVADGGLCTIYWGVNGTCQQGANRMLYGINKTVQQARGYWLTAQLWGTYGGINWGGCKWRCYR